MYDNNSKSKGWHLRLTTFTFLPPPPFCLVFVQLLFLSLNHIVFSGTGIKYVVVFCSANVCYFYGLLTTPCRGKTIPDSMGGFRNENDHVIDKYTVNISPYCFKQSASLFNTMTCEELKPEPDEASEKSEIGMRLLRGFVTAKNNKIRIIHLRVLK